MEAEVPEGRAFLAWMQTTPGGVATQLFAVLFCLFVLTFTPEVGAAFTF